MTFETILKLKNLILNSFSLVILSFAYLVFIFLFPSTSLVFFTMTFCILCLSITQSVHFSEKIAQLLGPAIGTLILALAVTIIEVAMIINLMETDTKITSIVARDTVFATVMLVANGIVGLSILWGTLKHKELEFQCVGTSSLMAALCTLSILTMVLPSYTITTQGPSYSSAQLIFVSIASLIIYINVIWAQTKSHPIYYSSHPTQPNDHSRVELNKVFTLAFFVQFIFLIISLILVIGLTKQISPTLNSFLNFLGAPPPTIGIIISILVLAPESLASVRYARAKNLQTSFNLAIGSAITSIALTIPVIGIYSLQTQKALFLGLNPKEISLLALTFIASAYTLATGKATFLHGMIHLIILAAFIVLTIVP